ncbi:hypothetical protein L484_003014 [Morus notabilis]|uniref:Actin-related protein 4 n=1 Tax=Morus notabilis TaxID=981085 RepID=W9QX87_9ROSA|nr:hypothetical protein L484_003014 [Morus notabilis]
MYGGDEVSAIVIDLGSHTCKAGYAGEDAPKAVFPSVVGSIDQMEVDDSANAEKNSGSAVESKNNAKAGDSEKPKGSRKLYVGSQALGFRRDYMEVLSPMKDGIVADWDLVDSIWDHAFSFLLFASIIVPVIVAVSPPSTLVPKATVREARSCRQQQDPCPSSQCSRSYPSR